MQLLLFLQKQQVLLRSSRFCCSSRSRCLWMKINHLDVWTHLEAFILSLKKRTKCCHRGEYISDLLSKHLLTLKPPSISFINAFSHIKPKVAHNKLNKMCGKIKSEINDYFHIIRTICKYFVIDWFSVYNKNCMSCNHVFSSPSSSPKLKIGHDRTFFCKYQW